MLMEKNYRTYIGTVCRREVGTLQGPDSDVILHIPESVNGVIIGCVHTSPSEFVGAIPEEECIIAPMTEYHYYPFSEKEKLKNHNFIINIPHCLPEKSKQEFLKVRYSDANTGEKFIEVARYHKNIKQDMFYMVDKNFINIHTPHFTKFCPSCGQQYCCETAMVFLFGNIQPSNLLSTVTFQPFLCSFLYNIEDYRRVIYSKTIKP